MAKNDKLAPKQESQIVTGSIPEYLRKLEGQAGTVGLEGMQREDLKMPRLNLCQSMTPQRKRDDPKYIQGLEEGEFFNTLTGTNFGEKLLFVPLLWYKSRILFAPLDAGGGLLCRADDAMVGIGEPGGNCRACPMQQFRVIEGKRIRPECTLFHNYIILILPEDGSKPKTDGLVALSFKSTGLDAATDLNALMTMRGASAAYAGVYELASASDTNAAGQQFYIPRVKNAGWVGTALFSLAEEAYNSVKDMKAMGRLDVDMPSSDQVHQPGDAKEM